MKMLTIILILLSQNTTNAAYETDNSGQCFIIFECRTENPYRPKSEEFIFNDIRQKKTPL